MKNLLLMLVLVASITDVFAQTSVRKSTRKSTRSTTHRRTTSHKDSSAFVSSAVDSFKRSLRYTPGRPYEVKPDTTAKASVASNTTAGSSGVPTTNTNANANPATGINNNNQMATGSTNANAPIRNVPTSPSMERNMADINQRPVNENSKNAIDGMNSSQVNTLNNNQMAQPPENWGFKQDDSWGRNTVGASQWSPGDKLSEAFNREFPGAGESAWYRGNRDTLSTMVQYRTNNNWAATVYNNEGVRTETRFQLAPNNLPDPVSFFLNSQNNKYSIRQLYRITRPGKEDVYRAVLSSGRQVYINTQGAEINY